LTVLRSALILDSMESGGCASRERVRSRAIPALSAALALTVAAGTYAAGAAPLVTPISFLDTGPGGWAYEAVVLEAALLAGICLRRWRIGLSDHLALGAALGTAAVLFLALLYLHHPSGLHDAAALLAMCAMTLHTVLAGMRFRHPALLPAGCASGIALLLVATRDLAFLALGEHVLLLASATACLVLYGAPVPPDPWPLSCRRDGESSPWRWLDGLLERRLVLAGSSWMAIVVSTAYLFRALKPGPGAVLVLAIPCWLGGACASMCSEPFPDRFVLKASGAALGFGMAWWTGSIGSELTALLLITFGTAWVGGVDWLRQVCRG